MSRSFRCLVAASFLVLVTGATAVGAQSTYSDPRDNQQRGPRYGDPQQDQRYNSPQTDPRDDQRNQYNDDRGAGDARGRGGASATFYADDRFSGRSVTLNRGVRRLGDIGMEDKISSIQVNSGRWLICEDDDFRGRCVTVDRSIGQLSRIGMEDKISSARPVRGDDRDDRDGYDRNGH